VLLQMVKRLEDRLMLTEGGERSAEREDGPYRS
jgi:hypothetical protein